MNLSEELGAWRRRCGVPAVGAALVSGADGATAVEVVGVRRRGQDEPATVSDRWHIGSCCKALTAALAGLLVESDALEWSTPLPALFPDLDRVDDGWAELTVSEVLMHRAGLPGNLDEERMVAALRDRRPLVDQRTEVAAAALARAPERPGRFVYSNLGYIVAGAAIERLTGAAYEVALRDRLLTPLGLRSAGFGPPTGDQPWGHRARWGPRGRGLAVDPATDSVEHPADNPPVMAPAGRLHLALGDWARLIRLFLVPPGEMLRPETVAVLIEPPAADPKGQAMGWAPVPYERGVWKGAGLAQQGSNGRWVAGAVLSPRRDRAALVVSNDGRGRVLSSSAGLAARLLTV